MRATALSRHESGNFSKDSSVAAICISDSCACAAWIRSARRRWNVWFSCRSRGLCPSCGQRRALEWAERMVEEVLPLVPYRHLTFTIPISLRKSFLSDRSLYGDLCRVAYASTRDFMQSNGSLLARQGKAVPAMIVSPQSFGDLLVPNAHAHSVVSLGLFRKDGIFFPMEELDFSGLEEIFRERFFQMLLRREKILPETDAPGKNSSTRPGATTRKSAALVANP